MNGELTGNESSLFGYLNFNEAWNDTIYDLSGDENHAYNEKLGTPYTLDNGKLIIPAAYLISHGTVPIEMPRLWSLVLTMEVFLNTNIL